MQIQLKTIDDLDISIISTPSSSAIKPITKLIDKLYRRPTHSPPHANRILLITCILFNVKNAVNFLHKGVASNNGQTTAVSRQCGVILRVLVDWGLLPIFYIKC